jgi:hypothetical protein
VRRPCHGLNPPCLPALQMAPLPASPFLRRGMGLDLSGLPAAMQPPSIDRKQCSELGEAHLRSASSAPEAERKRTSSLPSGAMASAAHTVQHAADSTCTSAAGSTAVAHNESQRTYTPATSKGNANGVITEAEAKAAEVRKQRALARHVHAQHPSSIIGHSVAGTDTCICSVDNLLHHATDARLLPPTYMGCAHLDVLRLLLGRERHAEALDIVEALLITSPGAPDLLCLRGNCLAAAGNNVGVG